MDIRSFVKTKTFVVLAALVAIALIVIAAFVVSSQIDRPSLADKTPDNCFSAGADSNICVVNRYEPLFLKNKKCNGIMTM